MKTVTLLITALFIFFAGVAFAQTNGLVGQWTNVDKTPGLPRLVVSQDKNSYVIQVWGTCLPTECDWGKVELKLLGDSVDDKSARYGFAHWD